MKSRAHALGLLLVTVSTASGGTIEVPGDVASIQTAIAASSAGDEILVAPGVYVETIDFLGKPVTVRSTGGPGVTTIDGGGLGSVVTFAAGEGRGSVLAGLTITGGAGTPAGPAAELVGGGAYILDASPTVRDCVFVANAVTDWGGGVYCQTGGPLIERCLLLGNTAAFGAGVYNRDGSTAVVVSCAFSGNEAEFRGGGMRNRGSNVLLVNCTFAANGAAFGGGVANDFSDPVVVGCILWGNVAPTNPEVDNDTGSDPTFRFSDVQGAGGSGSWVGATGTDGGGNIDIDPMLVDVVGADGTAGTLDDDLRPDAGSPAVDRGDSTVVDLCGLDLDGNERAVDDPAVADGGQGPAPIVDIGAFERGAPPALDCNGNGFNDACDVSIGGSADCDGDGVPDECQPDCNGNGIADDCDVVIGTSGDCNANGVPDECDLADGTALDRNMNGVPDLCDIAAGTASDCNGNGVPDDTELTEQTSSDCDGNGVPDECDPDCNGNGAPDACDIAGGTSLDLDGDGVPDECKPDCNGNGIPDFIDIAFGLSDDADGNGVPDECDCFADCGSPSDGMVSVADLLALLSAWGASAPCDVDGDGTVGVLDLLELLTNWGPCATGAGGRG